MDRIRVAVVRRTPEGARLVAAAARLTLSKKPVERLLEMGDGEVAVWVRELVGRGHGSPLEHASYTVVYDGISRVASHQLVRHRLASYTQQSMRYTEGYLRSAALAASERLGLGCPERPGRGPGAREAFSCYARALRGAAEAALAGESWAIEAAREAFVFPPLPAGALGLYASRLLGSAGDYYELRAAGARGEEARYLIPHAARTRLVATYNARELLESVIPLRTCMRAQAEVRRAVWLLWRELVRLEPAIFSYAGPRCVLEEQRTRPGGPRTLREYLSGEASFTIGRCPELVPRKAIASCALQAARTVGVDPLDPGLWDGGRAG